MTSTRVLFMGVSHAWWQSEKINKAALKTIIKKNIPLADSVPAHSATIIYGMAIVQYLTVATQRTTFDYVVEQLFTMTTKEVTLSIKNAQRKKRGGEICLKVPDVTPGEIIKLWQIFLLQDHIDKIRVQNMARREIQTEARGHEESSFLHLWEVVFFRITELNSQAVLELQCIQEEADGHLLMPMLQKNATTLLSVLMIRMSFLSALYLQEISSHVSSRRVAHKLGLTCSTSTW